MWVAGLPRPDHGPGFINRLCTTCEATWVGHQEDGDWCPWCARAVAHQQSLRRRLLLDPPQLRSDVGSAGATTPWTPAIRQCGTAPVDRYGEQIPWRGGLGGCNGRWRQGT